MTEFNPPGGMFPGKISPVWRRIGKKRHTCTVCRKREALYSTAGMSGYGTNLCHPCYVDGIYIVMPLYENLMDLPFCPTSAFSWKAVVE